MTELLILKSGREYIRIKDGRCSLCGLDKASVFPMNRLEEVREHMAKAIAAGFDGVAVFKLTLEETLLENGNTV